MGVGVLMGEGGRNMKDGRGVVRVIVVEGKVRGDKRDVSEGG